MHGDLLDVILLVVCVAFAFSGWRQGFVVGVLSFVGILGGGLLGTELAPTVVRHLRGHVSAPVVGIVVVFALASIGQLLAAGVGAALRRRLTWAPIRIVDSGGGAALSVVSVLLVSWLLATAVAQSGLSGLSRQVRGSRVIAAVDDVVPSSVNNDLGSFRRLLDDTGFPAIVDPLADEPGLPVAAPDPAVINGAAVLSARASIVKVHGDAPSCSRSVEGSGFVIGPGRVLTNAHVVAGVPDPEVDVPDGGTLRAQVVLYDPDRDVAVLAVQGLDARALAFGPAAAVGTSAVVAGYPENGPFDAVAARVRQQQSLRGPNIYQNRTVTRSIYALRAVVLPGNSGGPLLGTSGDVLGVVFAASTDTADTGYALTAAEVTGDAQAGRTATTRVSSGACD